MENRRGTRRRRRPDGVDVAREVNKGSLVLSSDADHLVDGFFDAARMLALLGDAVNDALANGFAGLWAAGDMTWEFGSEKDFSKLMEYECGLEEMIRDLPALSGICQYHKDTLPDDALHAALSKHREVYLNETVSRVNPFYSPAGPPGTPRLSSATLKELISRLNLQADS